MYSSVPPPSPDSSTERPTSNKTQSVDSNADKDCDSSFEKAPKNVPSRLWEKFKNLEKKADEVTRRSTEKRIKHLKQSVLEKVQEEISHPEDQDILRDHDVRFGPPVNEQKPASRKRKQDIGTTNTSSSSELKSEESWKEIKSYLSVNDHLHQNFRDKYKPKSGMEQTIDMAIAQGDISAAEEISDKLSQREFGTKIAQAAEARDFIKKKKEEEESTKAKKKKTLQWGFQQKQRWETKSNM